MKILMIGRRTITRDFILFATIYAPNRVTCAVFSRRFLSFGRMRNCVDVHGYWFGNNPREQLGRPFGSNRNFTMTVE